MKQAIQLVLAAVFLVLITVVTVFVLGGAG